MSTVPCTAIDSFVMRTNPLVGVWPHVDLQWCLHIPFLLLKDRFLKFCCNDLAGVLFTNFVSNCLFKHHEVV